MKNVLAFLAGAAIGAGVTAYFMNQYCEKRIREEVQSVKDKWEEDHAPDPEEDVKEESPIAPEITEHIDYTASTEEIAEMTDLVESEGYKKRQEAELELRKNAKPYMISQEEYSSGEYDVIGLTYYSDNILATDDTMEPVEDVEGTVGFNSLAHLMKGGPDDDIIYVRNDRLKIDYEVLRDDRPFSSILR